MWRKMCIYKCMFNVYKNQQNWQTGSRNLMGPKTLPTIWGTFVPIWSLWPNIRFLPSIVAEKNVSKNVHICSMCIKTNQVSKQEVGIWRVQKRYPQYGIHIWRLWPNIRFLPSTVTEKNATKNILDRRKDRGKTVYPPHYRMTEKAKFLVSEQLLLNQWMPNEQFFSYIYYHDKNKL
jgi:hypothetical protein